MDTSRASVMYLNDRPPNCKGYGLFFPALGDHPRTRSGGCIIPAASTAASRLRKNQQI